MSEPSNVAYSVSEKREGRIAQAAADCVYTCTGTEREFAHFETTVQLINHLLWQKDMARQKHCFAGKVSGINNE